MDSWNITNHVFNKIKLSGKIIYLMRYLPNFIVIFLSSSFLNRTVCTPDTALTIVDLPWATWPIVP